MHRQRRANDSVHWFMNELTSRIVAESGVPADRFHLGKIILQSFKDAPDFVLQIDGATDESETSGSVLERSVRCASSFRSLGLKRGDVILLMAPNHLDMVIPYYAALYLGITIAAVNRFLTVGELQETFKNDKPQVVFCQSEKVKDIQKALEELKLDAKIITFDKAEKLEKVDSFTEFLEKCEEDISVDNFKATDFNPEDTIACIISTSGTTGTPKKAIVTHKNFAVTGPYLWSRFNKFPTPTRMVLILSPIQWMSSMVHFNISPVMRFTRLQSSLPPTQQHTYHLINTYKPTFLATSTTMVANLFRPGDRDQCDFSCFQLIIFGGSSVPPKLIEEIKQVIPATEIFEAYGMTEITTYFAFDTDSPPPGSCGKPVGHLQYRIIDVVTQEDVLDSNVPGELWVKGPGVFKGYYNNYAATKEAFSEGDWFKTGDMFYRDENWNFYFVERIKLLIKYKLYLVSPVEVESVIRKHPGVFDVAVTGVPDHEYTNLVVACVVRRPDCNVTAEDIKDLVKESLDDWKQLRGGVVFLNEIPTTPSTKIDRRKLTDMAVKLVEKQKSQFYPV